MCENITPNINEDTISQLPALKLLQNLGYIYITPEEALKLRGARLNNVILEGILVPWLRENNIIRYKDEELYLDYIFLNIQSLFYNYPNFSLNLANLFLYFSHNDFSKHMSSCSL